MIESCVGRPVVRTRDDLNLKAVWAVQKAQLLVPLCGFRHILSVSEPHLGYYIVK